MLELAFQGGLAWVKLSTSMSLGVVTRVYLTIYMVLGGYGYIFAIILSALYRLGIEVI